MRPQSRPALFAAAGLIAAGILGLVLYGIGGGAVHETVPQAAAPTQIPSVFQYLKEAETGQETPEVVFTDANGKEISLADYRGRWLVLNLWATWCGPCVKELPDLAKLKAALPDDKIAVVAVDLEKNDPARIEDFFLQHQITGMPIHIDAKLMMTRSFKAYSLPITAIFSPDGKEFARAVGPEKWNDPAVIDYLRGLSGG